MRCGPLSFSVPMTKQDITRLFTYMEWANHLIVDAAHSLTEEQLHHDFQTGQHSVVDTLVHMLGAEWVWLERWEGKPYHTLGELEAPYQSAGVSLSKVRTGWSEIET